MYRLTKLALAASVLIWALPGAARGADVQVTTLVKGLNNPCSVAVKPDTGDVFVSDSGAGRVLRVNATSGKAEAVVTGFPKDIYGKGPMYDIGPLGLAFPIQRPDILVVGGGGHKDGEEILRFYQVPGAGQSVDAANMALSVGPITPGDSSQSGEGNFYAIATSRDGFYITSNGDDTKGWVLRALIQGGPPNKLETFIATKLATEVDAPVAITFDDKGHLVVGQMGEITVPGDSLVTLYNAESGKMIANAETGLFDIAGLAYSPSGKLYAVDYAWMDTSQGGLFLLEAETSGDAIEVKTTKIVGLDKPTSLAFGNDGTLYVTVFGTAKDGSNEKPGKVLKITGDL